MKKRIGLTIYMIIALTIGLFAQNNVLLHNFNSVPQSVYTNPSIIPLPKTTVGIPGLSSIYFNYHNSSLTFDDIITERPQDDSLQVNFENMIENMNPENQLLFNAEVDALFAGTRIKKGYLSLGINHHTSMLFNYPIELMQFLYYGNGDERFLDEVIDFSDTDADLVSYMSYHAGYASPIPGFEDLTVGGRLKFLKGMAAIDIERMNVNFQTSTDPQSLYRISGQSDFLIHTAGISTNDDEDIGDNLFNNENSGFAVDLGATYKINDKFTATAAVTDMGSIRWRTALKSYESDFKNFDYDGFYFDEMNDTTDVMNAFTDTLEATFHISEKEIEFSTPLPTRFNISGMYQINEKSSAGAMFYGSSYGEVFIPVYNVSYYHKLKPWMHLKAAYSVINNTYDNIGLGLSFHLGPIQAYMLGDNLFGMMAPNTMRQANFRFGINVSIFEKQKPVEDREIEVKDERSPAPPKEDE